VLGDSVNLASRLQGQCRFYGVPIIVGPTTARVLKDDFAIAELDFVMVKGKSEAQLVYGVVGGRDVAAQEDFRTWHDVNLEILMHYRKREWERALEAIERSRARDREGRFEVLRRLYVDRIKQFQTNPPSADWDGCVALDTK
jgi:adenylate cyclase